MEKKSYGEGVSMHGFLNIQSSLREPTSSRGADFSQLPTAPIQDFQVKPSTNHSARVLGQFPPVTVIFSMYVYTLDFTCC